MSTKKKEKVKALLLEQYEAKVVGPMNQRLDGIETYCKNALKEQNDRSKAIHGFIVREVQYNIANQLHNMRVTMDAFIAVFAEHGVKIEDLDAKIDAKKKDINAKLQKEAEERLKARMAADKEAKDKAAAEAAKPAEAAPTEAPAEQKKEEAQPNEAQA